MNSNHTTTTTDNNNHNNDNSDNSNTSNTSNNDNDNNDNNDDSNNYHDNRSVGSSWIAEGPDPGPRPRSPEQLDARRLVEPGAI